MKFNRFFSFIKGTSLIGDNRLKVFVTKSINNGGYHFAILVSHKDEVIEVTREFAQVMGLSLKETPNGPFCFITTANPGYDLEDWVNETWSDIAGESDKRNSFHANAIDTVFNYIKHGVLRGILEEPNRENVQRVGNRCPNVSQAYIDAGVNKFLELVSDFETRSK